MFRFLMHLFSLRWFDPTYLFTGKRRAYGPADTFEEKFIWPLAAVLTLVGIPLYAIYKAYGDLDWSRIFWTTFMAALVLWLVSRGINEHLRSAPERKVRKRFKTLPEQGTWDVNVNIVPGDGGHHILYMDVQFTKEDWRTIEQMGLKDKELLPIVALSPEEAEENKRRFGTPTFPVTPFYLMQGPYGFRIDDAPFAEASKQKFIRRLQELRGQVESYRDRGMSAERYEI